MNGQSSSTVRVTLQQPYFMPWVGFFRKVAAADIYIALDRANFRRNHLGRVTVLGPQGNPLWLTVPVGASQNQRLGDIRLPAETSYVDRFDKIVTESYSHARGSAELQLVRDCLDEFRGRTTLAKANLAVIRRVLEATGVDVYTVQESDLALAELGGVPNKRDSHIVRLINAVGGTELLTGDGSSERIHDFAMIERSGIGVTRLAAFGELHAYPQRQRARSGQAFLPGLSFVDCVLNVGLRGLQAGVLA